MSLEISWDTGFSSNSVREVSENHSASIAILVDDTIHHILRFLDFNDFLKASGVCKKWKCLSEPISQEIVIRHLGPAGKILKEGRSCWRDVLLVVFKPLQIKSKVLSEYPTIQDFASNSNSESLYSSSVIDDPIALKKVLEELKSEGKIHPAVLTEALSRAAESGLIENARLLIEFGAKDAYYKEYDRGGEVPEAEISVDTALLRASKKLQVEMVRFLLEQGSLCDTYIEGANPIIGSFLKFVSENLTTNKQFDIKSSLEISIILYPLRRKTQFFRAGI